MKRRRRDTVQCKFDRSRPSPAVSRNDLQQHYPRWSPRNNVCCAFVGHDWARVFDGRGDDAWDVSSQGRNDFKGLGSQMAGAIARRIQN